MIPSKIRTEDGDLPDLPQGLCQQWEEKITAILDSRFTGSDEPPESTDIQFSENAKGYLRGMQNRMNQEGVHFPLIYPFAKRFREHAIRIVINLADVPHYGRMLALSNQFNNQPLLMVGKRRTVITGN